jgi:hypothetical protein
MCRTSSVSARPGTRRQHRLIAETRSEAHASPLHPPRIQTVRHVRNVLIILAIAAVVAFAPGGGNAASTVLTALTMGFFAAGSLVVYNLWRQNELTLATLTDARRAILYGAVALVVLLIAGTDEFFATGGGTLAWILLLGAAAAAIWRIWQDARSY